MEEKKGKIPVNARINVDYRGEKPSVEFKYPRKDAVQQNLGGYHSLIVFAIVFFIPLLCLFIIPYGSEIPSECSTEGLKGNNSMFLDIECDTGNYSFYFSEATLVDYIIVGDEGSFMKSSTGGTIDGAKRAFLGIGMFFGGIIGLFWLAILLSKLLTMFLVKNKWFINNVPKINAWSPSGRLNYKRFTPEEIKDDLVAELPFFSNVILDYRASGEFGKYLERMEITEHDFWYGKIKRKKLTGRKRNISEWRAKFYFSKKPKTGYLDLYWK